VARISALLSGYAMDAIWSNVAGESSETGVERLCGLVTANTEVFPGVGAGDEYRFSGIGVVGAALVVDGLVAHLMAFPA
jgi:hypothetical protein